MSSAENESVSGGGTSPQSIPPTNSTSPQSVPRFRAALDRKRTGLQKKVRQGYRSIGRKLRKRKQTVLQWLGSGVSHYYLKFLGLWKPETSMGIVSDISRLQDEQQRVMTAFASIASKADQNHSQTATDSTDSKPQIPLIPESMRHNPE